MSLVSSEHASLQPLRVQAVADKRFTGTEQSAVLDQALDEQSCAYILEACGAVANQRVLDVGCGTGVHSRILDLLGAKVTAIGSDPERIARLRVTAPNVAWFTADLTTWELPSTSDPFDIIVAREWWQHTDFDGLVARWLAALSDRGRLVIWNSHLHATVGQRRSSQSEQPHGEISTRVIRDRLAPLAADWYVTYRTIQAQDDRCRMPSRSSDWQRITADPESHRTSAVNGAYHRSAARCLQIVIAKFCEEAARKPKNLR